MVNVSELNKALDGSSDEEDSNIVTQQFNMQKYMKKVQQDYSKRLFEYTDQDDINLLKKYLSKILDPSFISTKSSIGKKLDEYIEKSNNEAYSTIVDILKTNLINDAIDTDKFLDFCSKFIEQNLPIDTYYKHIFRRPLKIEPTTKGLFGDISSISSGSDSDSGSESDSDSGSDSASDSASGSVLDEETLEEKIEKIKNKSPIKPSLPKLLEETEQGKVAIVKESPVQSDIPAAHAVEKTFFQTRPKLTTQDCEFLYKKMPWVKDIIVNIFIHPIENIYNDIIDFNKSIVYNNKKFYQPKKQYYDIQCQSTKEQTGDILTIQKNGEVYKLIVAVETNSRGIIIQNSSMLEAEIEYIKVWYQNKNSGINDLKRLAPSSDMIFAAKFELSYSLQEVISNNVPKDYQSPNTMFITKVINTILKYSETGDEFVRMLSGIIIFLKIDVSFVSSSTFIKRLKNVLYLPEILPFLTDEEKLPEIFMVKNIPPNTKHFILETLEKERKKFTVSFFENVYIGTSTARKPTLPAVWNKPVLQQIELPDIKTVCKNKEDVEKEQDEDIVFYSDKEDVYCFNVYTLHDAFKKTSTPVNPYTNRQFSSEFVKMFLSKYLKKSKTLFIPPTKDHVTRLELLIEKELTRLENNLIETEQPNLIELFKPVLTYDQEKCMECKQQLSTDKISTIFRGKNVFFCSYDCLEKNKAFN